MAERTPTCLLAGAVALFAVAVSATRPGAQSLGPAPLPDHPRIQYSTRPATDLVVGLDRALAAGERRLAFDEKTGYLPAVLDALDVAPESQLLVFSRTGIQRAHTSPHQPRALYFNEAVVVGYIPGAPSLEVAAQDRQQGVAFYTLDQTPAGTPHFTRQTVCLTCHVSPGTLDVPGIIDRSQLVDGDGNALAQEPVTTVDHTTPHTQRWGGWFVTSPGSPPPYQPLGHLGNLTAAPHPTLGPPIVSDRALIAWLDSDPTARGYLSAASDHAALQVFDHQAHAMNLLTRLGWDARAATDTAGRLAIDGALRERIDELVDYVVFTDEAPPVVDVTPRPGFAERLAARIPADRQGRSLADLDLTRRLLRYSCSYMLYAEAFDGLPAPVKDAVYRRLFAVLDGGAGPRYAHLTPAVQTIVREILRDTKTDLPRDLR